MGKKYKDFELGQFDDKNAFTEVLPSAFAIK